MTSDVHHPVFARIYPWLSERMEDQGMAERRIALLEGLEGRVLEVGVGNGLNLRHYPTSVTEVVAVEPEPRLRDLARQAAADAPVPVEVVAGVARDLPTGDAAFDAVVTSLVLCSVEDQTSALAEVHRVLRPGGELRFFEHVRALSRGLSVAQRLVDASGLWALAGGGCHVARDTGHAIADAGFRIERIERFRFPETAVPFPSAPHILGRARRA
ncbi:MAG: class I SAM-dependent methyltransferase [Actinobacteria bacterium]|nr:class I SAM-dependent methyltransferase [Actinomycetota bacterium]